MKKSPNYFADNGEIENLFDEEKGEIMSFFGIKEKEDALKDVFVHGKLWSYDPLNYKNVLTTRHILRIRRTRYISLKFLEKAKMQNVIS